jgi:hypothetical protein
MGEISVKSDIGQKHWFKNKAKNKQNIGAEYECTMPNLYVHTDCSPYIFDIA